MARSVEGHGELSPRSNLASALGRAAPNLVGATRNRIDGMSILSVTFRDRPGSWLAIARVVRHSDSAVLVTFGSGTEWPDAIISLNKAIARGDWRPDRYASQP